MVTGKDVEGCLRIYLFKPFSRLAAARGLPSPPPPPISRKAPP